MEYWTKEQIEDEIKKELEEIDRIKREIAILNSSLFVHRQKLEGIVAMAFNQTKINFDENDTNQY